MAKLDIQVGTKFGELKVLKEITVPKDQYLQFKQEKQMEIN